MKTNPYVAIHCSKALSLRIGRHSTKFLNIKPLPHNLRIKLTAFTRYFTFKGPASAHVLACVLTKHFTFLSCICRQLCINSIIAQLYIHDKINKLDVLFKLIFIVRHQGCFLLYIGMSACSFMTVLQNLHVTIPSYVVLFYHHTSRSIIFVGKLYLLTHYEHHLD